MVRSEMNKEQIATHNQEICRKIRVETNSKARRITALNAQIREVQDVIDGLNKETKDYSIELCRKEGVSFSFIKSILVGKFKKKSSDEEE